MIERDNIDKILQNSLRSYAPKTDELHRNRFLEEAYGLPVAQTNNNRKKKFIIGGLLLMGLFAGMIFIFNPGQEEVSTKLEAGTGNLEVKYTNTEKVSQIIGNSNLTSDIHTDQKIEVKNTGNNVPETSYGFIDQKMVMNENPMQSEAEVKNEVELPIIEESVSQETVTNLAITDSVVQKETRQTEKDIPERKPAKNKNHQAMFNIYYRPEMIYNIIENEKLMHGLGAEFQYKMFDNKYVLGTGLGVSVSNGYFEYAINYNEFLGTYKKLDSISFNFNEQNFEMIQIVHTTDSEVFDTVTQTDYAKVYRKFVYLQIPFLMGYDFIRKENYSLGLRFSPILSILLTNEAVDFQYDAGLNQIVQINRITPERVQTNWQLTAGFNFTRYTKSRLFFEIEPRVTYYFNSVYQKSDYTDPPYGFGLRLGVGIR
jgi:hypothetical protein